MRLLLAVMVATILSSDMLVDFGLQSHIGSSQTHTIEVTVAELKHIYTGKVKRWNTGERITVFIRPYREYEQKTMLLAILGVSMSSFKEKVANSQNIHITQCGEIAGKVINTKGSIGLISDNEVFMHTDAGLIVLKVRN